MNLDSNRAVVGVGLCIVLFAAGCGDDDRPTPGGDAGAPTDAGAAMMDSGGGGADSGGGMGDAGGPLADAGARFGDGGCLTFTAASEICGFASDDRICALSVMCGSSSDDGQCKINCEMGTTVRCYGPDDVSCLESATTCTALSACGWIL